MALITVILAAGQGKRMHSALPKILHRLAGNTLLEHVVSTALTLNALRPPLVVCGYQAELVQANAAHLPVQWVYQEQQLGTGHALLQALPSIAAEDRILVLYGDVPLVSGATLQKLIKQTPPEALGIITAHLSNPTGLGRIVRDKKQNLIAIVEEKDADATLLTINEINTGIYLVPAAYLKKWLPVLNNKNAQGEFYLTDIISFAVAEGIAIHSQEPDASEEILGINDCSQLARAERFYQKRAAKNLMQQGVTLLDPDRLDVRGTLIVGTDVTIDINCIFEGQVILGNHCTIGPHCILKNVTLSDNVEIKAYSFLEGATIGKKSVVGPFARLRPHVTTENGVEIGNFIEIKNSTIGAHTKIHHVGYIGDSELGEKVNIGAGTITCNFDGANKHKTVIGNNAFVGSNTELVAPVFVGEGATIGAGSTITKHAPAHQLTLCRAEQRSIQHWKRPKKT